MQGICFKEPLFHATVEGLKTQTRRLLSKKDNDLVEQFMTGYIAKGFGNIVPSGIIKPRYKVGDIVYLKEAYCLINPVEWGAQYKYDKRVFVENGLPIEWKNKLFMPAEYARYFIEITAVRCERLQEISNEDCMKEGIKKFREYEDLCKIPISQIGSDDDVYHWDYDLAQNMGIGTVDKSPIGAFAALIDSIKKGTWDANPYVFVYEYKLIKK